MLEVISKRRRIIDDFINEICAVRKFSDEMWDNVVTSNSKLAQENKDLKEQIEKLQKKLNAQSLKK